LSSNIAAVEYEAGVIFVTFKNRSRYSYEGVPEKLYEELVKAESVGKFFNTNIKNVYPFKKVS
jgi:hypothetical protein